MPPFDIEGGLALALVRGAAVAACLSVTGALAFRLLVVPPVLARMGPKAAADHDRRWLALLWASVMASVVTGILWLVLQAAALSDASGLDETLASVPAVLLHSHFGKLLALRLALIAIIPVVAGTSLRTWRLPLAAGLGTAATVLECAQGHALSMGHAPSWLALCAGLHLLPAALWLGQLLPLRLVVNGASPDAANYALRRFSPVGLACVVVLTATALGQGSVLMGGLRGLTATPYGWTALVKGLLFLLLLVIAAANRFAFMPCLEGKAPETARRCLSVSLFVEAVVGFILVLSAGVLTSLPPGMHDHAGHLAHGLGGAYLGKEAMLHQGMLEALAGLAAVVALIAGTMMRRIRSTR